MKIRMFFTAIAVTAVSATALADLSGQYLDWGRGPVQFLMTKEEAAQWRTLKTDDDAKAFIALFWARRDPTPDTPQNEYKDQYDIRVASADKNFTGEPVIGSLTERGKALVLYGQPKRVERLNAARQPGIDPNADLQGDAASAEAAQVWTYEGDDAKAMFSAPRATIKFTDRFGNKEYKVERGSVDLKKAQERVIQASIKQPNLTAAPSFAAAAPAAAAPVAVAAPAAPAATTELTTAALQTAVNDFKAAAKNPYDGKAYSTYGEYITGSGEVFVPVMLYVPKSAGITATNVTYFGVVQDESGKNVAAFEEPATLTNSKDDWFVDKTIPALPAGKYRGIFGIAENGKPLAIASSDMTLAGTINREEAAVSNLILSNNLYPLSAAQQATDPFAFGGIKVVPKADHTFRSSDELWYFFELRNPGIPEAAADAPVAVQGETPAPLPKIQVKLDVSGTKKMTAPPREVEAIPMKGVEGHYGVGNAIPLATFKPGDYTLTVKVIDTVKKTSYTLTDNFKVVE